MLEKFLYVAAPADYAAAMAMYGPETLNEQTVGRLAEVYDRYAREYEGAELSAQERDICMAVDMMVQGRTEEELALLGLDGDCLSALAAIPALVTRAEPTREEMVPLVRLVWDEKLPLPVRIMLARAALDAMTNARGSQSMREGIVKVAGWLSGCEERDLSFASNLVGEVRGKWK